MHMCSVHSSCDVSSNFGGISHVPGEHGEQARRITHVVSDVMCRKAVPYVPVDRKGSAAVVSPDPKWEIQSLDPLINATHDTARRSRIHVRGSGSRGRAETCLASGRCRDGGLERAFVWVRYMRLTIK